MHTLSSRFPWETDKIIPVFVDHLKRAEAYEVMDIESCSKETKLGWERS